jgi:type VI secretion system protein ImpA
MAAFDVEQLLEPISPDSPCGENLEYDADFGEMERAAEPKADQQYGDTVIEGEPPDWKEVRGKALSLLSRTKDLRVAVMLARAAARTDGLPAFCDALAVVRGLIERYWQDVHPQLDPDDDNDPVLRVNCLSALCDSDACLRALHDAPLIALPGLGNLSYRAYLVAAGEAPTHEDEKALEKSAIDGAFLDADTEVIRGRLESLQAGLASAQAAEAALTDAVGVSQAADFSPLTDVLKKMCRILEEQLHRRGDSVEAEEPSGEDQDGEDAPAAVARPAAAAAPAFDQVRSRQDVIRLLDKICEYYQEHEPSSPVPLLLKRAKRVATMTFMDLLRDLAPSGLDEAMALGGDPDQGD